jgi:hypothetical protein
VSNVKTIEIKTAKLAREIASKPSTEQDRAKLAASFIDECNRKARQLNVLALQEQTTNK